MLPPGQDLRPGPGSTVAATATDLPASAVNRQVDQLQGIAAMVTVGVLVGAVMIASAIELVFQQHAPHWLVKVAEVAFAAGLAVAVVLVIAYLGQMLRRRRENQRE